ncbi:MAG: DNA-binding protein WhiA [Clostridia bacterium]|nr:DNA-binding protein WhiA [Clostridia bacterium]
MSFSNEIRDELCRIQRRRPCCDTAEAYGILAFANRFSADAIRISSEHEGFVRRARDLFLAVVGVEFEIVSGDRWRLELHDRSAIAKVFSHFGYDTERHVTMHFHGWFVEEDCCMAAFLRGAFLCAGVCADPAKSYHLELSSPRGAFLREFLIRASELSFTLRLSRRQNGFMLYMKESEHIEDFLTYIGASAAAMRLMEQKVFKDYRNRINRRSNCEFSNIRRTIDAAEAQTVAILRLAERGELQDLPEALRTTADIRIAFPDLSLAELCDKFDPPVSKSCLNHRLRKLSALAKEKEAEE